MGITIHYRGTMDDIAQIETMEDRVLDLAFSLGGKATLSGSMLASFSSRIVSNCAIAFEYRRR
jgi:hypothetical protein